MGQKINPTGFRLSVNRNWSSKWYANSKNFPAMLAEDIKVREYLKKKLSHAAVGRIVIERPAELQRGVGVRRETGEIGGKTCRRREVKFQGDTQREVVATFGERLLGQIAGSRDTVTVMADQAEKSEHTRSIATRRHLWCDLLQKSSRVAHVAGCEVMIGRLHQASPDLWGLIDGSERRSELAQLRRRRRRTARPGASCRSVQ